MKLKVLCSRQRFAFLDIKMCCKFPQIIRLLTTEKTDKWVEQIENAQTPKYM